MGLSASRCRSWRLSPGSALIGASGSGYYTYGRNVGHAYLFKARWPDATTGELLHTFDDPTPTESDRFGHTVALDGERVLIGAPEHGIYPDPGQAHLFDATTGQLLQTFDDPAPTVHDHFGGTVAIDGNRVLIGAWQDDTYGENVGQAHLFARLAGDVNMDGYLNVQDVVLMLNSIVGSIPPLEGVCEDVNGDGVLNILDAVGALNMIVGNTPIIPCVE